MEANVELLRRVLNQKLKKNPQSVLNKTKREQQQQLQETAKEFINSFENLSNQYFKKVGDEYLMSEFSELISDHMIKELAASIQEKNPNITNLQENTPLIKERKSSQEPSRPLTRTNSKLSHRRTISMKDSLAPIISEKKDEVPVEHPLASIKGQIGNIEEFINSMLESDKEIESRKSEILKLEDEKKNYIYDIFKLKEQIVIISNIR